MWRIEDWISSIPLVEDSLVQVLGDYKTENRIIEQSITIIKLKSITIINLNNEFSNVLYNWVLFSISFNYVNVPPTTVDFFSAAKNVNQTNIIAHYPSVQYTYY